MEAVNFELSKRLNELGLLDDIQTEYYYQLLPNKKNNGWQKERLVKNWNGKGRVFKTLTLEELPIFITTTVGISDLLEYLEYNYLVIEVFNFTISDYEKIINNIIIKK